MKRTSPRSSFVSRPARSPARSITGPLLASLGASALLVGLVTGAGEALALVLRLPFGTRADRSGSYWPMTIAGYALTAVCVPLLAFTPSLGAAGLTVGCLLVLVWWTVQPTDRELESGDAPVEAIALEVGYQDASFFGRLFRRKVALTPAQYRRRFQPLAQHLREARAD